MFDIGISLGFEGSTDEQITAGLKAVENAVLGVIVADEKLDAENKKLAQSAVALEAQIERNIRSYMSSSSAIYQAIADELGYGEALRQKIDLLRQIEQQVDAAARKKKEEAKAAQDEKVRIREVQAEIRELQRTLDAATAAKLRNDEAESRSAKKKTSELLALQQQLADTDAKISAQMIDDAHRVAMEQIAWNKKSIQDRIATLEQLRVLQSTPGIDQTQVARKFGAGAMGDNNLYGYKGSQGRTDASAAAEQQALAEIAWANKSWKERTRITDSVTQMLGNASISQEAIVQRYGKVAIEATKSHDAHVQAYRASLENVKTAHGHANTSFIEALGGLASNARARSEIIVLLHELMTGQFKRFGQSLIVLAEYGGLANFVLSATGALVIGLGIAIVGTAILMAKGSVEFDKVNSAIKTMGGYSGLTSQSFYEMATAISATHGTIGHAKEVMFALAESGRFSREQISSIAPAILLMSETSGASVDTLVKRFEALGKSPVTASIVLNEQFHYLTVAVYEQIAALVQQGNHVEAALLAQKTYATAGKEISEDLLKQLGYVASAWNKIKKAGSEAIAEILSWGSGSDTAFMNINTKIANTISRLNNPALSAARSKGAVDEDYALLATLYAEREVLHKDYLARVAKAAADARDKQYEQEAVNAAHILDLKDVQLRSPKQKREADIATVYNMESNKMVDLLRKGGINQIAVEEASKFEKVSYNQTTEQLLSQGKSRYDKMLELAKKYGVDVSLVEEQTARIIKEATDKHRNRAIPNASLQVTNDGIKAAEANFRDLERAGKAEISLLETNATSAKRIAADRLASDRAEAKNSNELHLVGLAAYEAYISKVHTTSEDALRNELAQVEKMRIANRARLETEQALLGKQKVVTGHDREEVTAKGAASLKEYNAEISRLNELEASLKAKNTNVYLEAQADTFRLMTQDLEQVNGALQKVLEKSHRQYLLLGMTKDQVKALDLQEKHKQQTIVESALAETRLALVNADGNDKSVVALYNRAKILQKLLDMLKELAVLEEKTAAKKSSLESGLLAGLDSYLSEVTNVFGATGKLVTKSFKGMEDSLVKFVTTGKGSFGELATSIIADMIRISIQQSITGPLALFFKTSVLGLSPGKATGGSVFSNSIQRVNEDGPELLEVGGKSYLMMGSQSGNVVPNNQLSSGGGGQQISITIHQTVGDVATVSMLQQSNAALVRQIRGGLARSQRYAGEFS